MIWSNKAIHYPLGFTKNHKSTCLLVQPTRQRAI